MKTIRVKEEWQRAGVYYVRTQAMVLGFNLSLEGEFADDTPDGKYILVTDDHGKPLSTNRIHLSRNEILRRLNGWQPSPQQGDLVPGQREFSQPKTGSGSLGIPIS